MWPISDNPELDSPSCTMPWQLTIYIENKGKWKNQVGPIRNLDLNFVIIACCKSCRLHCHAFEKFLPSFSKNKQVLFYFPADPPASEANRKIANLIERKIHTPTYIDGSRAVCRKSSNCSFPQISKWDSLAKL